MPSAFAIAATCEKLRGDGYCEIKRDRKGEPIAFVPLHPDRVRATLQDGRLRYAVMPEQGNPYGLDQDDMLHFPGFGYDGVSSMSVIQFAAFQAIGIALAADGFSGKFFANGATPKHLITSEKKMDEDQIEALKKTYCRVIATSRSPRSARKTKTSSSAGSEIEWSYRDLPDGLRGRLRVHRGYLHRHCLVRARPLQNAGGGGSARQTN